MREVEKNLSKYAKGYIPHRRPFAWVTQTQRLKNVYQSHPLKSADATRNKLGLLYMLGWAPSRLVEVRYPRRLFQRLNVKLVAPSFLEGSPTIVYRSKRNKGWGLTVDLIDGKDGLPEAVHRKIRFTGRFSVREIGFTSGLPSRLTYKKLYRRVPTPWQPNRILDLEGLL